MVAGRVSIDGRLDRLVLVRSVVIEDGAEHRWGRGGRWEVALDFDFDPTQAAEHWLANSHGFLVDTTSGDPLGVVDDLRRHTRHGRAVLLEVNVGRRGARGLLLDAANVHALMPAERRMVADIVHPVSRSRHKAALLGVR